MLEHTVVKYLHLSLFFIFFNFDKLCWCFYITKNHCFIFLYNQGSFLVNSQAEKLRLKEEMRREKEAARLKAANERATARKIAKESMELIDDERVELMEIAASRKGLPSILSLDSETLQNLELFRGNYFDTSDATKLIFYLLSLFVFT